MVSHPQRAKWYVTTLDAEEFFRIKYFHLDIWILFSGFPIFTQFIIKYKVWTSFTVQVNSTISQFSKVIVFKLKYSLKSDML